MRVQISGDKRAGYTWQLIEGATVLQSGHTETEAKAVVQGQQALIDRKRKDPWERLLAVGKLKSQHDT